MMGLGYRYSYNFGFDGLNKYNSLINYTWSTTVSSDYITDGVELVTNGGFDTDSDWSKAPSWSISGGVASQDGTQTASNQYISQASATSIGLNIVTFDLVSVTSGEVRFVGGGFDWTGEFYSTVGTHSFVIDVTSNTQILCAGDANFIGSIGNISVKKVIQKPNTMYLKDSGATPKYPAELHSGQGVLFNGVDQSVDYDTDNDISLGNQNSVIYTAKDDGRICHPTYNFWTNDNNIEWYDSSSSYSNYTLDDFSNSVCFIFKPTGFDVYLDGVYSETVSTNGYLSDSQAKLGERSGSFKAGTLKDLYIFNDTLTPQEISKYSTNPNGFFQDVQDGVIDNCVLNMPLDGTDEYVRDYANYSETIAPTDGISEIASHISMTDNGDGTYTFADDGTVTGYWDIGKYLSPNSDGSKLYRYEVAYTNISGFVKVQTLNAVGTNQYKASILTEDTTYSGITLGTDNNTNKMQMRSESQIGSFTLSIFDVYELSGIHKIANYTTSARDTTSTLNYGTQELNFTRDGLWRGDLSKYYEMDGTQVPAINVPMRDTDLGSKFAIEFVMKREHTQTLKYLLYTTNSVTGLYLLTNHWSAIGRVQLGLWADGGTTSYIYETIDNDDYHHIIFENDGSNLTMIVDGVAGTPVAHSFVPSGRKFSDSAQASPKGTLAMFYMWDEATYDSTYNRDTSIANGAKIVLQAQGA